MNIRLKIKRYINGHNYETLNLFLCRTMIFIQYFSLEASAFMLSLVCIDRYVTVLNTPGSIYSRLPFTTPKTAYIWSLGIITVAMITNSHILVLNGWLDPPYLVNITYLDIITNKTLIKQDLVQSDFIHCYEYQNGKTISLKIQT